MPLGYWLPKPTVGQSFGVALALLLAVIVGAGLWISQPPRPTEQRLESFDHFFAAINPECAALLRDPASASVTPNEANDCEKNAVDQRKGYRDLEQAIRAANAAEDAAWLSLLQTRASIVGAAFLVLTLFATAWTARTAADAARIARSSAAASVKAADAAESAVTVARDTAKRQLRAYVSVETIGAGRVAPGEPILLTMRIKNYGATPALRLAPAHAIVVRKRPYDCGGQTEEIVAHTGEIDAVPRHVLHPGSDVTIQCRSDFNLSATAFDNIKADRSAVFVSGFAIYRDIYDEEHVTRFRMEFSGDQCFRTGKMRISPEGNEAT